MKTTEATASPRRWTAWRVFRIPALLAAVSIFGLISALLGDGIWNALSWGALGVPLLVIAYFSLKPAST